MDERLDVGGVVPGELGEGAPIGEWLDVAAEDRVVGALCE